MMKIRALIVDDSIVMRKLIAEVLSLDGQIEVVGTASNGRIALQRIPQVNPDVITLDVEMPEMDGVQALRELRLKYPKLPVIMFSALTHKGAAATLDALSAGANDYVTKPLDSSDLADSIERLKADLLPKIHVHCDAFVVPPPRMAEPAQLPADGDASARRQRKAPVDLICIGASTGGPVALEKLFAQFPSALPVPVAIVQHMPPMFTQLMAQRLDSLKGPVRCVEAENGMILKPGFAIIAKGGHHLALARDSGRCFQARLTDTPPENSCRPAVDVLFRSAAGTGSNVLGVVLTGMGQDGLRGSKHIREGGGQVIAQDQATSVVWGMPGAVVQARLANCVLPIGEIAFEIARRVKNGLGPKES
ncbi:MAG: chemotaxis response regulator protein-glutamate methylesterase [Opitutaceae bacterium]|jgi:two-component system chemotaxis response regulator CheB